MDQITTACMLVPCESSKRQFCRVVGPVLQFLILKALSSKARRFSPLPICNSFDTKFLVMEAVVFHP